MPPENPENRAVAEHQRRLFAFSLGLFFQRRVRQILARAGWKISFGIPVRKDDAVAVWGRKPVSRRGRWVARRRHKQLLTIEDAFLRSVRTGRQGDRPHGVVIDRTGIYFDTANPSDLRSILMSANSFDAALLARATKGIDVLRRRKLSKYNGFQSSDADLPDGFVLVTDQTRGDASVRLGRADESSFRRMLEAARNDHPDRKILIKTHPETRAGKRKGYFSHLDTDDQVLIFDEPVSPWDLFAKAHAVYCVTSQLGMEAIFAGHRPVVFGAPFYSGWGLSEDRIELPPKAVQLTREHLFAAAYLIYPTWYDPFADQLCDFEKVADLLEARKRAFEEDSKPKVFHRMRLWKRGFLRRYFSSAQAELRFCEHQTAAIKQASEQGSELAIWAAKETPDLAGICAQNNIVLVRIEDGFIRSSGLGANLVRPMSLVTDRSGIYYDATQPSDLETLIARSGDLPEADLARARALRRNLVRAGLSKYNLERQQACLDVTSPQEILLVVGQVEDDASIRLGAGEIRTNLDLIKAARAANPEAFLVYKPHPDVESGLRSGSISLSGINVLADHIAENADIIGLIEQCDQLWTMTSLAGFEALLRDKKVTCTGMPFYAGWGLTRDIGLQCPRRRVPVSLDGLVHAALIAYPRYWDPVTGIACPVEVVLARLVAGNTGTGGAVATRLLAKVQGLFASYAHVWR